MKKIIALSVVCLLAGCASDGEGKLAFPNPARANPAGGTFVNVDNLRQYGDGMTKRQLYDLLGTPHFDEGMWGVRQWNYLFQLRPGVGTPPLACQFQIDFNGSGVATGHAWQPASCGALLQPATVVATPESRPVVSSVAPIRLSSDVLFAFGSASLSAIGYQALASALVGKLDTIQDVTVIGYTDRLGSVDYNKDLSQRRAESVRQYLIQRGVPPSAIRAEGRGVADPVVQCDQTQRRALVTCLTANRRVEISGIAHD